MSRPHRISLIAAFILVAGCVNADEIPGIYGQVVDAESGLPLRDAHVNLVATTYHAATDEMGRFSFGSVGIGTYALHVTHVAYQQKILSGVIVTANSPTQVAIRLSPECLELPEVLVVAEPIPEAGFHSGVTIVTGKSLRMTSPDDLANALEKSGFVTITSDNTPGGKRTVSLRGSASDQVLVLVDGQPLNPSTDGIADLAQISISEVQQVELYPQAPSSLGAQAIGGVINIVTLDPGLNKYRLETGISQFGARRAALTLGRSIRTWRIVGIVEHQESSGEFQYQVVPDDGLDIYTRNFGETLTRKNAAYRRDYFSFKLNPSGPLQMAYRQTLAHRQNPDYLPETVLSHVSTTDDIRREFSLSIDGGGMWYHPEIHLKVEGYHQETLTDYGPNYPLLYNLSKLVGEAYSADLRWNRQALQWSDVSFGLGSRLERLWSSNLEGNYADRWHQFGFMQAQGTPFETLPLPVKIGIFSGVRADIYRDEEVFIYPRLGLELGRKNNFYWSIRGELAGAYKLPTFNSLFWQEDLQAEGNPNLKPERSQNEEITGRVGYKSTEFNISYFNREVRDLIYWRLDFDDRWKPLNIAESWIYGTEYSVKTQIGTGDLYSVLNLSHRWMHAINKTEETNTDGNLLPYRPVTTTTLSLQQGLPFIVLYSSARWISERYTNEANTKSLNSYKVWDVGVTRRVYLNGSKALLEISLQVNNLLNENYRIISGAPVPLREFRFGLNLEIS